MNRYKILAVSFALVLIGILIIQAYWVRSVIEVRNKQFDNAVFSSIQSTVAALEQKENITFITKLDKDTMVRRVYKRNSSGNKQHPKKRVRILSEATISKSKKASATSYSYEYSVSDDSGRVEIVNKFGPQTAASAFVFSSDSAMEINVQEMTDTLEMEDKLSKIGVLMHKIAAGKNDSILELPKGEEVEKLMRTSLAQNNVDLPFYIGIKLNDTALYNTKDADTNALTVSEYKADLFPNDVLNRRGMLFVSFPGKNAYIFSEMTWLLVALLVFTLLILFMFYSTLSNFKKQKKLNELKSDFINNMTHELKTPLATIQLASDVIMKQVAEPDSQINQMAKTIKTQSKKMDEDVKNILQFALLENNAQAKAGYSIVNLKELLATCVEHMKLPAIEKQVHINYTYNGKEEVSIDKLLLEKMLNNLIDNAVKYSGKGQEVKVTVHATNDLLEITVKDNGVGIEKEDLPHVFEKFYRAGKGNIHYNKGYGLGLSFVKKIVDLHQGTITIQSEPSKETSVKVLIPQSK